MPVFGWILLIAGLSFLAVASIFALVHHTQRRMPTRQTAEGDATDISTPLPMHVVHQLDSMTARELEEERQKDDASTLSYELAPSQGPTAAGEVITDLPPAAIGEVIFYRGGFWKVDSIEPTSTPSVRARLILSPTTDAPRAHQEPEVSAEARH